MKTLSRLVVKHPLRAWILVFLISALVGWGAEEFWHRSAINQRQSLLETEAARAGIAIVSQTLNSNIMGALALLGLVDETIKLEASGNLPPNGATTTQLLESLRLHYEMDGIFVVGGDGRIRSSCQTSGKTLTGVDIRFRPYFHSMKEGRENIYAAVGTTSGERTLYFVAPAFVESRRDSHVTGGVVARYGLSRLDRLISGYADLAFLLSPQGLVFASSRPDWIGLLAGSLTPEKLKAIRELKQFGTMFDQKEPLPLPISLGKKIVSYGGRSYALATANLNWNDPQGAWTVVLMEDLRLSLPLSARIVTGFIFGLAALMFGILFKLVLRARNSQAEAVRLLQKQVEAQEIAAERKTRVAEASLKMHQAGTLEELGTAFLLFAHSLLGTLQGAFYVLEAESGRELRLMAEFGCSPGIPVTVTIGDGLIGQCALEKKPIHLDVPEVSYWKISSGLGASQPRMVILRPVMSGESLIGVVELAALKPFGPEEALMVADLMTLLGLNVEILIRRREAKKIAVVQSAANHETAGMIEDNKPDRNSAVSWKKAHKKNHS